VPGLVADAAGVDKCAQLLLVLWRTSGMHGGKALAIQMFNSF
jgi:hypothetical protein